MLLSSKTVRENPV